MAVLHSWPLASDPAHLARLDNDDAALNTWAIAWVAHILPRQPLQLFEAPIFYPEAHTLAYSEHMIVPAIMGAPLIWMGASPVLAHNVLIIAGLAFSGWAMCLVIGQWTGSASAGIAAGLLYAFNAHVLTRFAHLQAQHVEFLPLMLYAFDRVLAGGRPRHTILLAGAFVLQSLCCNYLLVFGSFALAAAAAVRHTEWATENPRAAESTEASFSRRYVRTQLLLAAGISVLALAPFLWPYYEVSRDQGLIRSVDEVSRYSAGWRDYLATGGRLHYGWWSHFYFEGSRAALFPGITALTLAGVALVSGVAFRDRRARMAVAFGLVGFALSFGTTLPGYAWVHEHVPLLAGLRNAARWGWLGLAALAILAGFGVATLERLWAEGTDRSRPADRFTWPAMAATICLLATVEAIRTPVGYTAFAGIPRIYDRLADEAEVVLAEFPFYSGRAVSENGRYVLANTRYFKPLVNGYSGFQPALFEARGHTLDTFPSEVALTELRGLHVTHVTVHTGAFERRYGAGALPAIDRSGALQLVADEDGIRLYRLR